MAGYTKHATNMVGLMVAKTPKTTLQDLYTKTLAAVTAIPQSSAYRQQVETLTQQRLDLVNASNNIGNIEKKINAGQIEEVIVQAQDELSLVEKMASWQSWEPLETVAPQGQWQ